MRILSLSIYLFLLVSTVQAEEILYYSGISYIGCSHAIVGIDLSIDRRDKFIKSAGITLGDSYFITYVTMGNPDAWTIETSLAFNGGIPSNLGLGITFPQGKTPIRLGFRCISGFGIKRETIPQLCVTYRFLEEDWRSDRVVSTRCSRAFAHGSDSSGIQSSNGEKAPN